MFCVFAHGRCFLADGVPALPTLLATDKTGMLTQNQMQSTDIWDGGAMASAFQSNNDNTKMTTFNPTTPRMRKMDDAVMLNSRIDVPFA
jgi:magnesium-transporting ATPase (P-type)